MYIFSVDYREATVEDICDAYIFFDFDIGQYKHIPFDVKRERADLDQSSAGKLGIGPQYKLTINL